MAVSAGAAADAQNPALATSSPVAPPAPTGSTSPAAAPAETPSDASLRELLALVKAKQLVTQMEQQMNAMMDNALQQGAAAGHTLTPQQQQTIERAKTNMRQLVEENLDWSVLEPIYLKVYRETFSQADVDGMIAFYKTPSGQAVIEKLPLVMQRSMAEVQHRIGALVPKIQKMTEDTLSQLKASAPPAKSGS